MDQLNSTIQTEMNELEAVMANLRQCSRHHMYLFHQAQAQAMRYREALVRIIRLREVSARERWETSANAAIEIAEEALEGK